MMKKLTVNTLAIGNLRQRKKQYIVLVIGIILAMIFSSGIMFFISCTRSSTEEYKRRTIGDFYGYLFADEGIVDFDKGVKDGYVEKYGYAHIIGYLYSSEEEKDKGTPVAWLDENAKELYYLHFEEGRYPEVKGEIALERDAALRLGIKPSIGEKVSLSMLTANGTDYLLSSSEKTYTVVGILTDKRKNIESDRMSENTPPLPAAFVCDNEKTDIGGKEINSLYFSATEKSLNKKIPVDTPAGTLYASEFSVFTEYIYEQLSKTYGDSYNYSYFLNDVSSSFYGSSNAVNNSAILSITLSVVLMLASCIGIVNAFSANLKERKQQIGMLRAVGATRRQIINIFGREAFIISIICFPISILISYYGVKLYAFIMGDDFIFIPDFKVLAISSAVSIICVMLAAIIPLFSASKISPIQAIRNIELSRKMKYKKIKSQKKFEPSMLLAKRNIMLNRGRRTAVSLILIITIFISAFGFSFLKEEYVNYTWGKYNTSDYVVRRSSYPSITNYFNFPEIDKKISYNNINDIIENGEFESVYGYKEAASFIAVDEYSDYMRLLEFELIYALRYLSNSFDLTKSMADEVFDLDTLYNVWFSGKESELYEKIKTNSGISQEIKATQILGYDTVMIKNNLDRFEIIDGRIDIDKLESGEEILLVAYENAGFAVRWDDSDGVESFGIYDMEKGTKNDVLATAVLDIKAGDTLNLHTVYSDVSEVDWQTKNFVEATHLTCYDKEVKVGAIIKPFNFSEGMYNSHLFGIVTTSGGIDKITGRNHGYENLNIDFDGELDDNSDEAATEFLNSIFAGTAFSSVSGYASQKRSQEITKILMISLLSIVILMFCICAGIVNNSLTAKIREGKKDIGTLRAVGASSGDIVGIYIRQLIYMFAWGMGIGFIGYSVIHIIMKYFYEKIYSLPYFILPPLLICVLLCVICGINLYIKVRREMQYSIVENIREL